jgi:hypothetical protein
MKSVEEFLKEIDRQWKLPGARICLRIIGSSALMLRAHYDRGTKDSDVLETDAVTPEVKRQLIEAAGKGTDAHRRHGLYIDIVQRGLPFLPQMPIYHALSELNRELIHLEFEVLDVVDVVVTKLKRFNSDDRSDIRAMADQRLIDHAGLLERFRSAVDVFSGDARAEDLPSYVKNLHRVERDYLLVPESAIDLPDWIG